MNCLVTGAGGFIGSHLVNYLRSKGHWVRGVDLKQPEWGISEANEFNIADLRSLDACLQAVSKIDYVYDLAADMGGMGFISDNNASNLYNNTLINTNMIEASRRYEVKRYLFTSSVCIYPGHLLETLKPRPIKETDAYPANPSEGYGWQKLVHEKRCEYYQKEYGLAVRVARLQNTYGPKGTYEGGREKAPAALCRKVALAKSHIEVWGDGKTTRTFTYVDDTVEAIYELMQSNYSNPVNIGTDQQVSIKELAEKIIKISNKKLKIKYVSGPQGARGRKFDHKVAESLGIECKTPLSTGIGKTYQWVKKQVS